MYAIVRAGGRQEKVAVGDVVVMDRQAGEPGASVALPVLHLVDGTAVTTDPAVLAKAMDKAEKDLVKALEKHDLSIRTNNFLEDTLVKLEGQMKYNLNSRQQRLHSVIRGN